MGAMSRTRFSFKKSKLLLVFTFFICFSVISRVEPSQISVGNLAIYFNDPLAGLPHMRSLAAQANGLDKALIELIDSATKTLDVAVYTITKQEFIEALGRACGRGVQIRIVTESESYREHPEGYKKLEAFPCVSLKTDAGAPRGKFEHLMHHKFFIVDRAVVWTSSHNWTQSGISFDANHAVKIADKAIAQAYLQEFEEMFTKERFGKAKPDNNEERFQVGAIPLELYFTPSDSPERILIDLIKQAKSGIQIAMFAYTHNQIHDALVEARKRGVKIEAIWDFRSWEQCEYSDIDEMLALGVGTLDANPGLLHHKFAVLDGRTVITGSANWSASGMQRNDENVLIIHEPRIAQLFMAHFNRLRADADQYDSNHSQPPRLSLKAHSVLNRAVRITWRPYQKASVSSYEICRAAVSGGACDRVFTLLGKSWYALDTTVVPDRTYYYRMRSKTDGRFTDYSNEFEAKAKALPVISADEAEKNLQQYLNKLVTVRFKVFNKPFKSDAGNIFLNSKANYKTDFTAFIPKCAVGNFQEAGINPVTAYEDKTIEVTGELIEYNGPEIVVHGPWQIKVVGP